ncbi:MAG: cupin domain-containing protein [Bacteroidales bacterium]|jgi:cupin 2 domain-containing protein|nr:cupin domain-containing protein [Bacteroidales bacterium]
MNKKDNIFDLHHVDFSSGEEIVEVLTQKKNVRIERIISSGEVSAEDFWYDQPEDEFVVVLQGEAKILFEDGEEQLLNPGDYLIIPSRKKHRVSYTSSNPKCIWLAVFYNENI